MVMEVRVMLCLCLAFLIFDSSSPMISSRQTHIGLYTASIIVLLKFSFIEVANELILFTKKY